ncbi:MAG: ATP-binding cassette domain-containing protein [Blastopirellula sp. JB062]
MNLSLNCSFRYPQRFSLHAAVESSAKVTALCGASGSGKTTILMLIAGLLRPQSGTIGYASENWVDVKRNVFVAAEMRRVGVMFQEPRLFPHLDVRQNVTFGWKRRKGDPSELERAIDTLEIGDLLSRSIRSLSGGQQQRVAFARALVSSPRLLLLDEPLTSVEPRLQSQIADYVCRVAEEYATPIVLVSHSTELVDRMAEQVFWVRDGTIDAGDPP